MRHNFALLGSLLLVVSLALTTACGSGNSALNPAFQPQISNQPDNFQFQVSNTTSVTQTLTYPWSNSGTAASVNQACTSPPNVAFVTLKDSKGIVLYSGDLSANGTYSSLQGATGNWTIIVTLTKASGTINFRVQKM